jgi:hypothetical protein
MLRCTPTDSHATAQQRALASQLAAKDRRLLPCTVLEHRHSHTSRPHPTITGLPGLFVGNECGTNSKQGQQTRKFGPAAYHGSHSPHSSSQRACFVAHTSFDTHIRHSHHRTEGSHQVSSHVRAHCTRGLAVQFDSDDDAAAEEEEEALRLQREQAAKLDRAHFNLAGEDADEDAAADSDLDDDDVDGDATGATLGGVAAVRSPQESLVCHASLFGMRPKRMADWHPDGADASLGLDALCGMPLLHSLRMHPSCHWFVKTLAIKSFLGLREPRGIRQVPQNVVPCAEAPSKPSCTLQPIHFWLLFVGCTGVVASKTASSTCRASPQ